MSGYPRDRQGVEARHAARRRDDDLRGQGRRHPRRLLARLRSRAEARLLRARDRFRAPRDSDARRERRKLVKHRQAGGRGRRASGTTRSSFVCGATGSRRQDRTRRAASSPTKLKAFLARKARASRCSSSRPSNSSLDGLQRHEDPHRHERAHRREATSSRSCKRPNAKARVGRHAVQGGARLASASARSTGTSRTTPGSGLEDFTVAELARALERRRPASVSRSSRCPRSSRRRTSRSRSTSRPRRTERRSRTSRSAKKGRTAPGPTLIEAYGGFEISLSPGYRAARRRGVAREGRHVHPREPSRRRRVRSRLGTKRR